MPLSHSWSFFGKNVLPLLFIGGLAVLFWYMMERRSTTPAVTREAPVRHQVTFEQIGGQDIAKRELIEALDFLRHRERIRALGIRPLTGILLTGPPGTGKTLMAKAAATHTDSVFLSAAGSEFVEMYVGVGAQRVRDIFRRARAMAKKENKDSAIIFIDEIDVVGGRRGQHSHQEYDQTLNQLLTEMDGMSTVQSPLVLLIAATNRPDILDPALLRPGRFDRQIKVELPDKEGRLHILRILGKERPVAANVDFDHIARETYGFSGAQLESLVNEAAIIALRQEVKEVTREMFRDAVDKVLMGGDGCAGRRRGTVPCCGPRASARDRQWVDADQVPSSPYSGSPRGMRWIRPPDSGRRPVPAHGTADGAAINVALAGCLAEELHYGTAAPAARTICQASPFTRTMVRCWLSRSDRRRGASPEAAYWIRRARRVSPRKKMRRANLATLWKLTSLSLRPSSSRRRA